MVNEVNEDDGWYRLTLEGKEKALKLLEGQTPSSLNESLASASIILTGFKTIIREALSRIDEIQGNREENFKYLNGILEKTTDLCKRYLEASFLTKEL